MANNQDSIKYADRPGYFYRRKIFGLWNPKPVALHRSQILRARHKAHLPLVVACPQGSWFAIDRNIVHKLTKRLSPSRVLKIYSAYSIPSAPGFIKFFGSKDCFIDFNASEANACLPFWYG